MDVRRSTRSTSRSYDTVFHLANIANDPSVELNPYSSWEVNVLAGCGSSTGPRATASAVRLRLVGERLWLKSEPRVTEELELLPLSDTTRRRWSPNGSF